MRYSFKKGVPFNKCHFYDLSAIPRNLTFQLVTYSPVAKRHMVENLERLRIGRAHSVAGSLVATMSVYVILLLIRLSLLPAYK